MAQLNGEGHAQSAEAVHVVETVKKPTMTVEPDAQELIDSKFPGQLPLVYEEVCKHYPGTTAIFIDTTYEQEIGSEPHLCMELETSLDREALRLAGHSFVQSLANRGLTIYLYLAVLRRW